MKYEGRMPTHARPSWGDALNTPPGYRPRHLKHSVVLEVTVREAWRIALALKSHYWRYRSDHDADEYKNLSSRIVDQITKDWK